jgi:hypothetical protein
MRLHPGQPRLQLAQLSLLFRVVSLDRLVVGFLTVECSHFYTPLGMAYAFFFVSRDTNPFGGPVSDPSSFTVKSILSPSQVTSTFLAFCAYVHGVDTGPVHAKAFPPDWNSILKTPPLPS